MVKKKSGKMIQLLTPENYIRKKSRDLPIVECTVNSEWEKSGMATVTVARGHSNGNVTYCLYLVDLLCLGVKDTLYNFNVPVSEYNEFKDKQLENFDLISIDYTLAHNIIFAGIEYAEDYGFKPRKDFTSITQYHLEEDNDDVELIDIECGMDGKPTYFRGPNEDDKKVNQIIAQLERTAGAGNYHFVIGDEDGDDRSDNGDNEDDEVEDNDDRDDDDGEIFEENTVEFISLITKEGHFSKKEVKRLCELTEFYFDDLIDDEMVDEYFEEFSSSLSSVDMLDNEVPDELLGVEPGDPRATDELKKMFIRLFNNRSDKTKEIKKRLDAFRKAAGDIPAVYFCELELETEKESTGYEEKLKQYALRFPNYSLLKIIYFTAQSHYNDNDHDTVISVPDHPLDVEFFFPGRKSIHKMELLYFITFAILDVTKRKDPSEIEAIGEFLHELDLPEKEKEAIMPMLMLAKIAYMAESLLYNDNEAR